MKYPVLSDINMGQYKAGTVAELTDAEAAPLLACGAIGEAIPEPKTEPKPKKAKPEEAAPPADPAADPLPGTDEQGAAI